jgi:hypothetical protein
VKMVNSVSTKISIGPGFLSCLSLLLIALKLAGCITWSWGLVLAPLWGPVVLLLPALGVFFIKGR